MAGKTTQESIFNNGNQLPGYTQGFQNSNPTSPVSNQPTTTNYLYQTFYRFSIKRLPRINYFAQKVTLPEFASVGAIQQPTRFSAVNHPSTKVSFANLNLEFIIDEKLENWRELYNWMRTIYLVNSYDDFEDKDTTHFTEGSLHILNSAMVPTQEIRFHNLLPISLSGIEFDSTDPDLAPRTATATFAFDFYEFV
jgi:hypothetical protein|tara:strand:- start:106 stop:690 length:585 start_codon:yes stop_codon:yes gene_type:complete